MPLGPQPVAQSFPLATLAVTPMGHNMGHANPTSAAVLDCMEKHCLAWASPLFCPTLLPLFSCGVWFTWGDPNTSVQGSQQLLTSTCSRQHYQHPMKEPSPGVWTAPEENHIATTGSSVTERTTCWTRGDTQERMLICSAPDASPLRWPLGRACLFPFLTLSYFVSFSSSLQSTHAISYKPCQ